jgi:predicted lactoylglutathione lyase
VIKQVIINLPVADLPKSIAFFKALGFSHNPQFTDDTGACIVVSDTILVMLLTHARFRDFTPKAICDTSKAVEVLLTLSCESREQVDGLVAKAVAAGGSTYDKPEDYGFMYTHSFVDPHSMPGELRKFLVAQVKPTRLLASHFPSSPLSNTASGTLLF